jgi:hypothetical protein
MGPKRENFFCAEFVGIWEKMQISGRKSLKIALIPQNKLERETLINNGITLMGERSFSEFWETS